MEVAANVITQIGKANIEHLPSMLLTFKVQIISEMDKILRNCNGAIFLCFSLKKILKIWWFGILESIFILLSTKSVLTRSIPSVYFNKTKIYFVSTLAPASGHSRGVRWKVNSQNGKHISHFSPVMEAQATSSGLIRMVYFVEKYREIFLLLCKISHSWGLWKISHFFFLFWRPP